jgi:hypothetical protein
MAKTGGFLVWRNKTLMMPLGSIAPLAYLTRRSGEARWNEYHVPWAAIGLERDGAASRCPRAGPVPRSVGWRTGAVVTSNVGRVVGEWTIKPCNC